MKNSINKFLNSTLFIILIGCYTLLSYVFKINYFINLPIITFFVLLITFTCNTSKSFIPLLLFVVCSDFFASEGIHNSPTITYEEINIPFVISMFIIILLCFIFFFFKNRRKNNHSNSLLNISILIIGCSFLLTDLFVRKALNFIVYLGGFIVIYFIKMTNEEENYNDNFLPYFLKTIFYFGLVMATELIYVFFSESIKQGIIVEPHLGWTISNNLSLIFLLIIPVSNYLFYKEKNIGYIIGLFFMMFTNLFTLSRGGVAIMALMSLILLFVNYKYYPVKKHFWIFILIISGTGISICLLLYPVIKDVIDYLLKDGASVSGRFELYKQAIEAFKNSPLLGGGTVLLPFGNLPKAWFHSTLFDCLGQLGIVGLIAFAFHFFVKYKTIFKNQSMYKWFVFIGFISSGLYALVDVAYFHLNYLIFYFLILCSLELAVNKKETIKA